MTSSDNEDYSFVPVSSVHVSEKYNRTGIRMAPMTYVLRKGKKKLKQSTLQSKKKKKKLPFAFLPHHPIHTFAAVL